MKFIDLSEHKYFSERELVALFRIGFELLVADGVAHDKEKSWLFGRFSQFFNRDAEWVAEQVRSLVELTDQKALQHDLHILAQMNRAKRQSAKTYLWELAYSDNDLHESEVKFLYEIEHAINQGQDEFTPSTIQEWGNAQKTAEQQLAYKPESVCRPYNLYRQPFSTTMSQILLEESDFENDLVWLGFKNATGYIMAIRYAIDEDGTYWIRAVDDNQSEWEFQKVGGVPTGQDLITYLWEAKATGSQTYHPHPICALLECHDISDIDYTLDPRAEAENPFAPHLMAVSINIRPQNNQLQLDTPDWLKENAQQMQAVFDRANPSLKGERILIYFTSHLYLLSEALTEKLKSI